MLTYVTLLSIALVLKNDVHAATDVLAKSPQKDPRHLGHHGSVPVHKMKKLRGGERGKSGTNSWGYAFQDIDQNAPAPKQQPTAGVLHFLFMLTQQLPHQQIWERFFESAPRNTYSIWAHCAGECNEKRLLEVLPSLHIVPTVQSKYCVDLVTPMTQLLKRALAHSTADPGVIQKFLFVSDSTLPVKPYSRIYEHFTKDDNSDFCFANPQTWASYEVHRQSVYVVKHSQWAVLNKEHASKLALKWRAPDLTDVLDEWDGPVWNVTIRNHPRTGGQTNVPRASFGRARAKKFGCADEEAIFASLFGAFVPSNAGEQYFPGVGTLSSNGMETQGRCDTFAAWDPRGNDLISAISGDPESTVGKNRTLKSGHPLLIRKLGHRSAGLLRSSHYLFARKFSLDVTADEYQRMFFSDDSDDMIKTRLSTNYTTLMAHHWCGNKRSRLLSGKAKTKEECLDLCTSDAACGYVTFAEEQGTCATWSSCGSPTKTPLKGAVLYSRTLAQAYKLQALGMGCGKIREGGWLAGGGDYTMAQCQDECTQTRGCLYITFGDPLSESNYDPDNVDPAVASCDLWSTCEPVPFSGHSKGDRTRTRDYLEGTYTKIAPTAYPLFERAVWCGSRSSQHKHTSGMGHTLETCQDQCSGDAACKYMTFHKKNSWCATWSGCEIDKHFAQDDRDSGFSTYASYIKVDVAKLSPDEACFRYCSTVDVRLRGRHCVDLKDEASCLSSHSSGGGKLFPCSWTRTGSGRGGSCHMEPHRNHTCNNLETFCLQYPP